MRLKKRRERGKWRRKRRRRRRKRKKRRKRRRKRKERRKSLTLFLQSCLSFNDINNISIGNDVDSIVGKEGKKEEKTGIKSTQNQGQKVHETECDIPSVSLAMQHHNSTELSAQ